MDFLDLAYYTTIFVVPIAIYSVFFKKPGNKFTSRNPKDWFYPLKLHLAKKAVKRYQLRNHESLKTLPIETVEKVKEIQSENHEDSHFIHGADQKGNHLTLRLTIRAGLLSETFLSLGISGENYKIPKNSIQISRISKWHWKNKNLTIEILEPLNKLRVTFNGLLEDGRKNIKHVKFNYIWISASGATFHPQDASAGCLADALANEKWRDGDWISQIGDERGYDQFGTLNGTVTIEKQEIRSILPSNRTRFWGTSHRLNTDRSLHLFVAGKDGTLFDIWLKQLRNGCNRLVKGHVVNDDGTRPIDSADVNFDHLSPDRNLPAMFTLVIVVGKSEHRCVCHLKRHEKVTAVNDDYDLIGVTAECDLDAQQAHAVVEFWYRHERQKTTSPPPPLLQETVIAQEVTKNCVNFADPDARNVKVTGGKGCSLAQMATIRSDDFEVPDGFVVTTTAYKRQLDTNPDLKMAVKNLDDICCGRVPGKVEDACALASDLFKNRPIDSTIIADVTNHLSRLKNDDANVKFAVRSSGIDEDGEDLSAAGQNETYLGLSTDESVIDALSLCWASLYALQSVKYRHQHGVRIRTEMAVVVQKMVPAESAGVLFTCHPSTADPSEIVITSNYGLGESVVSGRSDPDTIIVKRHFDNTLNIETKSLGQKNQVLQMAATGIETVTSNLANNNEISLTDKQIVKLAAIGLILEEKFGNFRDVEWAICQNRIYLLQSRPITSALSWTEYELTHEFDSPILSERGIFTVANTGEVFPGATSILTLTTFVMSLDRALQMSIRKSENICKERPKCTKIFYNHLFLDVVNSIHVNPTKEINMSSKILDLAIFGHPIIDEKIHRAALQRWGIKTPLGLTQDMAYLIKLAWNCDKSVKMIKENAKSVKIDINEQNSLGEIYAKIDQFLDVIPDKICIYHCHATTTSVFYQMMALNVLAGRNKEFTVDHYHDTALLLSSCQDVVSAEIPKTLEKIAKILEKSGKVPEFSKIPPDGGADYLKTNNPEAYALFQGFLKDHGHRVFGEFDLINEPWASNPSKVIEMIQANAKSSQAVGNREKAPQKNLDDVIASLITPSNEITRKILKFLMARARRAVGNREQTKCEIVRSVDELRRAYKILARKLVSEGLLPDEGLIYHLSHYEVRAIIAREPHSPVLITKALRRMRLWPKWDETKFGEITYGFPLPEIEEDSDFIPENSEEIRCAGTPVCAGTVKARACVITSLNDIGQLENGDILITYCTDIGWSPYFPMLSGIVTELGGLVSHGAVVAREYGLPSIVGVQKATRIFKTGDLVQLSGGSGLIRLISR